jgi:RNA polymerase sigma-70 factor (ECF subfamily)
LDPNVVRLADPQVLPPDGEYRIQGLEPVVSQTLLFRASATRAKTALIDGRPGIVVLAGDKVRFALVIRVRDERIVHYEVVADPQRLALLHIKSA